MLPGMANPKHDTSPSLPVSDKTHDAANQPSQGGRRENHPDRDVEPAKSSKPSKPDVDRQRKPGQRGDAQGDEADGEGDDEATTGRTRVRGPEVDAMPEGGTAERGDD